MKKQTVFLDTSVLIAGVLSKTGASNLIIQLEQKNLVDIVITNEVALEARVNLLKKYGQEKILLFYKFLLPLRGSIKPCSTPGENRKFYHLIEDKKDCHILAGAKKYKADVLLTLDRRHFMTSKILTAKLPFKVKTPGEFLKELRRTITI